MRPTRVHEAAAWDARVRALPRHHVLQGWAWGEFKSRWGWTPSRWQWGGEPPVAAAQLLRRPIPRTPFGIGYVPKGPLVEGDDPDRVVQVLRDLETIARAQRCLYLKIDPDVRRGAGWEPLLRARGWVPGEPIQFPNTGLLDLTPDEESLLANMKSKSRYNIRLAARRGVRVTEPDEGALQHFFQMYAETAARDGFLIRPEAYYLDLWRDFLKRDLAHLLVAEVEGDAVAGLILFHFGDRVWYMYGASTDRHRNLMPTYALQWEAIRWARSRGARLYDLWGAPDDLEDPEDGLAGVWRFKSGFGVEFREQIGAWDFPVSRPAYALFTGLMPRLRAALRGR